jgi:hypothetical protein
MSFFPDRGAQLLESATMTRWTTLTLSLATLVLGACGSPPEEVAATSDGESSGSTTSGGPGPTTMTSTTMPGEDTVGTMGATSMETTMGAVDTTTDPSTSVGETTVTDPTTSGNESSSSGPPPECMVPGDCPNNETCSGMGECVALCMPWGTGSYGPCLNDLGGVDPVNVCGANHFCVADPHPYEVTACISQACVDACDCPAPPATGDAVVTCASITSGDMINDCYLSCANGETCPDGMECLTDGGGDPLLCATPVPPSVPVYGNCDDLVGVTCDGGSCGIFGSASVCTEGCAAPGDCEPAPPGAAFAPDCANVFDPPAGNECFLPCTMGSDCPVGMACSDVSGPGGACTW